MQILSDFICSEDLAISEKMVYLVMTTYADENNVCGASYSQLAENLDVSYATILRTLKTLASKGLVKVNTMDIYDIKKYLENKNMNGSGVGNRTCEWCKGKTYILHAHHFPVRRENGGEKTVNICPNCHQEFHFLESYIEIIDKGYIKL